MSGAPGLHVDGFMSPGREVLTGVSEAIDTNEIPGPPVARGVTSKHEPGAESRGGIRPQEIVEPVTVKVADEEVAHGNQGARYIDRGAAGAREDPIGRAPTDPHSDQSVARYSLSELTFSGWVWAS